MEMIIKISISKNEGKAMIKEVKEIPIMLCDFRKSTEKATVRERAN